MKLYFRILMLPVNELSCFKPDRDNIPLINFAGQLSFLWDKSWLNKKTSGSYIIEYKLKKIG